MRVELRTLSFCTWRPSDPVHQWHILETFVFAMALDEVIAILHGWNRLGKITQINSSYMELYRLINCDCAMFCLCHCPRDFTLLSTCPIPKPSGRVESKCTSFRSFHVTQMRLPLWRKSDSPLTRLLTCSHCWSTMSWGRYFLFPLTVPQALIPFFSSSRKRGTLVYQLSTNNL